MRTPRFRFTIGRLMIAVALTGLLIWGEQTRRRWSYYHHNYLFFCQLETENLELLGKPYERIQHYCGMVKPKPKSEAEWRDDEAYRRACLVEELEHFRARKLKYAKAMWRPWCPIEPDAYTAK